MPGKRKFEEQLAALDGLRHFSTEASVAPLRKALAHKNNFVVGKAADLVRELYAREPGLTEFTPDLLTAFDRFFRDPVKTDPQCWAKTALSRALSEFEFQDEKVFLRGMRHIQLEPVWGGSSDSAGTLRATCAFGLVQCRRVREMELLEYLIEMLADKDKAVRVEIVRAIEQVGSPPAALLLRTRATLGSDEPEILGACYGGVLRLEGSRAIPWVSRFLATEDDAGAEAALALAGTHSADAFEVLRDRFGGAADPWFCSALLSAIALTRQDAAVELLLGVVEKESPHAEAAIEAICRAFPSKESLRRIESIVAGSSRLKKTFEMHRSPR